MKATILAVSAFGLLFAAPAIAQMDNAMSNGSMKKTPMSQSQKSGSMGSSMSNQSGKMTQTSESKESAMTEGHEHKMAMKHRKHHKKHHRMHHMTKMPAKASM